jgi:hypothetical protein
LAALLIAQARLFLVNTSATYDEPLYLKLGLQVYREGSFAGFVGPMTPPLPILLAYWPCAWATDSVPAPPSMQPRLCRLARWIHLLLAGVPLVLLVYGWLTLRRGPLAGFVGGALLACSPNVLAHAAIAATDTSFALFSLISLALMDWYQRRPALRRLCLVGLATGLALAAKQSAVFLFPTFLAVLIFADGSSSPTGENRRTWHKVVRTVLLLTTMAIVALLPWWACHGFATTPALPSERERAAVQDALGNGPLAEHVLVFLDSLRIPVPIYTLGAQMGHATGGHEAFLFGMRSERGWWYYFPFAMILKGTPADWLLLILALYLCFRSEIWRDPTRRLWALAGLIFFGLCLWSRLNLGLRYLSVLYPLLILFAVDGLFRGTAISFQHVALAGGLLVGVQAVSAASIAPHFLSYFNPLVCRPDQGHLYLVDSNLDWGQDLPELRLALAALGAHRPVLAYFGTASPESYGVSAIRWRNGQDWTGCDFLALSATYLQGVGLHNDPFARLRRLAPTARAGYSILIFDLSQPEVQAGLE